MDWFPRAGEARTGGHRFKARGGIVHRNLRDNYFKQRLVGIWYMLPEGGVYMVRAARGSRRGGYNNNILKTFRHGHG